VVKERTISRDILQCALCKNECLICLSCDSATVRRYPDGADKRCFACSNMISGWEDGKDWLRELSKTGHCSWCFAKVPHTLFQYNKLSRSDYVCSACSKKTLQCKSCDNFTRAYSFMSDRHCLKCAEVIKDWDDPIGTATNPDLLKHVAWCSWCIEKTDHKLDKISTLGRTQYTCGGCGMGTLQCKAKKCSDGMAKTGETTNDDFCIKCEAVVLKKEGCSALSGSLTWETMHEKKLAVIKKNSGLDVVKRELTRESNVRDEMKAAGLERPFLLLCSMTPMMRNVVACSLGFALYTTPCFGTVHLEAYSILTRPRQGMQNRVEQSYEKLNPLAGSGNWYLMLKRVIDVVFHQSFVESLGREEAVRESGKPFSAVINDLELEMLMHIADLTASKKLMARLSEDEHKKGGKGDEKDADGKEHGKDGKESTVVDEKEEKPVESEHDVQKLVSAHKNHSSELHDEEGSTAKMDILAADLTEHMEDKAEERAEEREREQQEEDEEAGKVVAEKSEAELSQEEYDRNQHVREAVADMVGDGCTDEELDEAINHVRKMLVKNAGIQQEDLVVYTVKLSMACASLTGVSQAVLTIAAAMAPAVLASASMTVFGVLATPLLLVSLVGLASSAIQMGFGSTEGRLIWPIAMMLNQRLLLAIQDININDYYTAIDDDKCCKDEQRKAEAEKDNK